MKVTSEQQPFLETGNSMDKLVILAPVITSVLMLRYGAHNTYLYFILPLMMLVPAYLLFDGPGVPPMSFYSAGLLPFLLSKHVYRSAISDFHLLDLLLYWLMFVTMTTEMFNNGFGQGRQQLFLDLSNYWIPYMMARSVILRGHKSQPMAIVFVICMAVISAYSLYTFRFGVNHYLTIRANWPYTNPMPGLAVWPRWGYFRAAGPFMHPITSAMVTGFILPLAFWLYQTRKLRPVWLSFGVLVICAVGLITPMSRGPMVGALMAITLYLMGQSKYRAAFFTIAAFLLLMASAPLSWKITEYFDATRDTAGSTEQESVLYRRDLLLNYVKVIKNRPWLGYGLGRLPIVNGQNSIDNAYLHWALTWGVLAVIPLVLLILGTILGLTIVGLKSTLQPTQRGQAWALTGGIVGCAFSLTTVFMPYPNSTILFIWIGWSTALMSHYQRGYHHEEQRLNQDQLKIPSPVPTKMNIL